MPQLISWLILAAIHALPALALFRPAMIGTLYGIASDNPLFLLLQHRAALFLVIFLLCVWAAFDPASRRVASVGVGVSMVSFLFLYWSAGSPPALKSIAIADLIGIPVLAFVSWKAFAA
jgi:tetrahydromethanopterin S-methyltransferase subunit C